MKHVAQIETVIDRRVVRADAVDRVFYAVTLVEVLPDQHGNRAAVQIAVGQQAVLAVHIVTLHKMLPVTAVKGQAIMTVCLDHIAAGITKVDVAEGDIL